MQYKKKIFFIIISFVFMLTLANVKLYALPTVGSDYDDIPDYSGEETLFGKLTKESEDIKKNQRLIYHSNWAWWQNDIMEEFDDQKYVLYCYEYLIDIPYKILWNEHLDPGQSINEKELVKQTYSKTIREINEEANNYYIDFSFGKTIGISLPIDILKLSEVQKNDFKFGWEYTSKKLKEIDMYEDVEYNIEKEFHYTNNYTEPVFVYKCFRQRFNVVISCLYKYNYEKTRFGSGGFGRDDNYKYSFKNYNCLSCDTFLIPFDKPYFKYSVYLDRGYEKVCISKTDNVIYV